MRLPRPFVLLPMLLAAALACASPAGDEVRRLQRTGRLPEALARAEAAVQAAPADADARFLQGVLLLDLKRDADALAVFRRMTEDFPELPDPFNNIALLEARAGRLDAARIALETALRNDPAHHLARANLGEIHLRLAIQAWEQAASQSPADPALERRLRAARELAAAR